MIEREFEWVELKVVFTGQKDEKRKYYELDELSEKNNLRNGEMKGWEGEREEKYEGTEWAGSKRMVGKEERSVKAE